MKTYFAPAERLEEESIRKCVEALGLDNVINTLLLTSGGILAILNKQRQVLAVNHAFLRDLGIRDAESVLGLRLGEVASCEHAHELVGGCGTSKWCSTCGAAIAMVTALGHCEPAERKCVITVNHNGVESTLCLEIRACAIEREDETYLLVYIKDITDSERRAALERAFVHDLKNVAMGIQVGARMLESDNLVDMNEAKTALTHFAQRLQSELIVHAALANSDASDYQAYFEETTIRKVLLRLGCDFEMFTEIAKKKLTLPANFPTVSLRTDLILLLRVLGNMVTNALEASPEGGEVKVSVVVSDQSVAFTVWNAEAIDPRVCLRIFQQYFTTKGGAGRGLGTFSMKLLGEKYLGGKVDYKTSKKEGTFFTVCLPRPMGVDGN